MRILLITKTLEPKGGVGRYSNEINKVLLDSGVSVSALSESNKLLTLSRFGMVKFFMNLFIARREAANFDIIHAMEFWPYGVYGHFAVLGTKKKLFMNGIGTYTIAPFKNVLQRFFVKRACLRASQIFSISDYTTKKILENISLNNISTIFYGTLKLPVLTDDQIKYYKSIYGIGSQYPILLTVGDIKNRKGQLETLKAVGLLKKEFPEIKYFMIGSDDDAYYLQKIKEFAAENNLEKNYEIISNMYDDRILSFFYQVCDIFLLNSNNEGEHFEGFGGVLLEAAQFGKPVIGSKNCGIESALKDGYNGYLTQQANPEDIKNKILLTIFKQ